MLEVVDITVTYGPVEAVRDLSFKVKKGTVVTLIGPNGAGKTTTLNALSGLIPVRDGKILLDRTRHHPDGLSPEGIRRRRAGARRAPGPGRHDRARKPRARRLSETQGGCGGRCGAHGGAVFHPRGTATRPGGNAFGGRAADAGHRSRTHGSATPAAARQAVPRACPQGSCRRFSTSSGNCGTTARRFSSLSKTPARPSRCRAMPTSWKAERSSWKGRPRSFDPIPPSSEPTWANRPENKYNLSTSTRLVVGCCCAS